MKRAAILFSGLARTYKKTHSGFFKTFINSNENWDIDIYLAFQPFSQEKDSAQKTQINADHLISAYKPFAHKIYKISDAEINEKYNQVSKTIKLPKHVKKEPWAKNSILRQYYGWATVIKEIKNKEYDLVIRNRFDIVPKQKVNLDSIAPEKFTYFKRVDKSFGYDDFVFASNQENMTKIMNIYDNFLTQENPLLLNMSMTLPEHILCRYVRHLGIEAVQGPQLHGVCR